MPDTILYGTSGDDILSGGNGKDTIYGGDGDDVISGGNGVDNLFGDAGNDQLTGDNGSDNMTGGADDDVLDGKSGFDTAYYSGAIGEYSFFAAAGYLHIIHQGGAGADGHDQVINVERLVFADRVIDIGSGHNAPVAGDDHVFIDEDTGTHSSGAASVLDNDFDFDGDAMTVVGGTFVGAYGTLTLNADGTYSYTLSASAQALAAGENVVDSFNYTVTDNDGSDTGVLAFHVAGLNDAPVANPDTATTGENDVLAVDVLGNDSDIDNNAILSLIAASAPAGQGTAAIVGNQVQYDPGTDFEALAVGESEEVVVNYTIEDEHGASASSTLTVTVTGANDGPVANPDSGTTGENTVLLVDALANDTDVDNGAVLTIAAATAPAGQGTASIVGNQVQFDPGTDFDDLAVGASEEVEVGYSIEDEHGAVAASTITITVTGVNDAPVANPDVDTTSENFGINLDVLANDTDADTEAVLVITAASVPAGQGSVVIVEDQIRFDPGTDFDHLGVGESEVVVVSYTIQDEHGASSSSTVTITVEGREEGAANTGTEDADTLTGTPGDDTINALGGDDTVFGLAGDDLINGGAGRDYLSGDEDNDLIDGGSEDDFITGGSGNDQLFGQTGNDSIVGDDGDDELSGGDGFDVLSGDAGSDVLTGGNDDDILSGGAGDDALSGNAGNDSLDDGEGNDSLDGGDGNDFLIDFAGTNSLTGGLGDDFIVAGSADGAQTIEGGDGSDTIHHYYRHSASTITTGAGSDTVDVAYADQGTAAIVITDFTPGAGGDVFDLASFDGALLSLLSGWDGSSNPFGSSGFLRLQQSGTDTLLEWDQDGGGDSWETLVVFENTDPVDFTDANFVPAYDPDGSAPGGQTITGTNDGESLTGTLGDDTIDALGGDDAVLGQAGGDTIYGGDGNDQLYGEADDDVIEGGNDDDFLSGGDGADQLSGQAGNDVVIGDSGNDQLSGGADNDSLEGGEGDDALDGGDGNDFLTDFAGINTFTGGLGDDFVVAGSADGAQTIDAGDGSDTIRHNGRNFASTIATGTGSDTLELLDANIGSAAIIVTDFTPGAGGDLVQLAGAGALLSLLSGWDGSSNPFGSGGFLRLQQSGTDTLLEWDQDGGGDSWETLVVFENTDAGDFTDANFAPAYHPDGSPPAGGTITGTNDGETLIGTIGGDTIDALGGDDTVLGQGGGDTIYGGDGNDSLSGEADNDVIEGGNDDDFLSGGEGDDQLSGQAGNDVLVGQDGADQLTGGDGDDSLDGGDGDDALDGGEGNDFLSGGPGTDTMDGGGGSDTLRHVGRNSAGTITTGTGADRVELLFADMGTETVTVTDFTPGAGGDLFALGGASGSLLGLLSGWDGSSNPFDTGGFLRLQQSGTDTLLEWDQDGGGDSWETLVVFENTDADDFSDANFTPGYDPDGTAPAGLTIVGTNDSETLTGTIGGDTISALGGEDVVLGQAGADVIDGGDGNDFLYGEEDDDIVSGGNGEDFAWGGDGNDQLSGQASSDTLFGENGDDVLSGGDGNDSLDGGEGDDSLAGGNDADYLAGGVGADVLTGGAGADLFAFQSASDGPDEVTDFVSGTDLIVITASGFGGGLTAESPVPLVAGSDPVVEGGAGQFLYDTDSGTLFWDGDGTGSEAAVLVATFTNLPSLTAADFVVV